MDKNLISEEMYDFLNKNFPNHSANSIRNIIINILRKYKISVSAFKIYLKADYSELH